MLRYILKRLFYSAITILLIITITFFLMQAIPGDPFSPEKIPNANIRAAIYEKYGLNEPLYKQYFKYLGGFFRWNFGVSYTKIGLTVNDIISEGFPYSLMIGIYSSVLIIIVGITAGIVSGLRQNKFTDRIIMLLSTLGSTIPSFVLATGFLYIFSRTLGWVPSFGIDVAKGYIGPVVVLAAFSTAFVTRLMRSSILDVMEQDYIRTARAKGISDFKVIVKHGLRNAILPVVTYIGPMIASIVTGSFVIEKIFGIPGIGSLFTLSILNRDYTLIMGITVFFAIFLITTVLVVDVLYVLIDPRIKFE